MNNEIIDIKNNYTLLISINKYLLVPKNPNTDQIIIN